jgi:hypothetical protein
MTRWLGDGCDVLFTEFGLPTYRSGDPSGEKAVRESSTVLIEEHAAAAHTARALKRCGAPAVSAQCSGANPTTTRHSGTDRPSISPSTNAHSGVAGRWLTQAGDRRRRRVRRRQSLPGVDDDHLDRPRPGRIPSEPERATRPPLLSISTQQLTTLGVTSV